MGAEDSPKALSRTRSSSPEHKDSGPAEQKVNDSDSEEKNETLNEEEDEDTEEQVKEAEEQTSDINSDAEEGEEVEDEAEAPPLPDEELPPPLPDEAPPSKVQDDGWQPLWDHNAQAYYFYNRFTGVSQWDNPRVPDAQTTAAAPGLGDQGRTGEKEEGGEGEASVGETDQPAQAQSYGGYNPAIHGDYDPTAPYAQVYEPPPEDGAAGYGGPAGADPSAAYAATGAFNRFTGKWQDSSLTPDRYTDENKSRRQMNAFFDVDAAANTHDGRSLRAERAQKKLSKKELKEFKDKRRQRKEEKRRAWLRD